MVKNGKTPMKVQRFRCVTCKQTRQEVYSYQACAVDTNARLVQLLKESCGTRSISRILNISATTVTRRILEIASKIKAPVIPLGRSYQMDEMFTFIVHKKYRVCIAYAIDSKTKSVAGFSVGRHNKGTLRRVTDRLILSEAKEVNTDKLSFYLGLIPKEIHKVKRRGTNHIERKNLTLRTHIKRLNRRSIAYSKSLLLLSAVVKIYFWG